MLLLTQHYRSAPPLFSLRRLFLHVSVYGAAFFASSSAAAALFTAAQMGSSSFSEYTWYDGFPLASAADAAHKHGGLISNVATSVPRARDITTLAEAHPQGVHSGARHRSAQQRYTVIGSDAADAPTMRNRGNEGGAAGEMRTERDVDELELVRGQLGAVHGLGQHLQRDKARLPVSLPIAHPHSTTRKPDRSGGTRQRRNPRRCDPRLDGELHGVLQANLVRVVALHDALCRRLVRPNRRRLPAAVVPRRIALVQLEAAHGVVAGEEERHAEGAHAAELGVALGAERVGSGSAESGGEWATARQSEGWRSRWGEPTGAGAGAGAREAAGAPACGRRAG